MAEDVLVAYQANGEDMAQRQLFYLLFLGAQMLLITALGAGVSVLLSFLASRTAATIARNLRERMFTKVVSFSDAEVQRFSAASLITRATNDVQQVQMVCMVALRMVLFAPIMAIGGIIMVVQTDVSMSWVIAVAILAVFFAIGVVMVVAMPKFKIMQALIDKVNLVAREILTGLPVIRAFNRQGYESARFDDANETLMRTQLFTNRAMAFMQPVVQLIMNGTTALVVWVGAGYVDAGSLQTGQVIAFITYAMVIVTSFMMMSMIAIMLPRAEVAAGRIDEVLACESSIADPEVPRDELLGSHGGAAIEFRDVSFCYDADTEPVLDQVSFTVPAGSTTAIIGGTGSGKSTVLKLLMRFYDVTHGAVLVDGVDVRDLSQRALREQMGYVPQQSYLFSGTIASNVAYGSADMQPEQIEKSLELAQAAAFVHAKEDGIDSEVSQGGTNVSGGQRQRLAIARALASNARAFLFDDSFSALDYATDAALRRTLASQLADRTVIIVAQRIGTIRHADNIVVLDGGRIVGQGTHGQLLSSCPLYREIASSQLSAEEMAKGGVA